MQTDPANYRNAKALADQAVEFSEMAPNIVVKVPGTKTGIEAIERGLKRRGDTQKAGSEKSDPADCFTAS